MITNKAGIQIIKDSESLRLKAYLCPAKVWTIGWGTTVYPNGEKVKEIDTCTKEDAERWLMADIKKAELSLNRLLKQPINSNQFSALVSFVYNLGASKFKNSTLLRKTNADPNDPDIVSEFVKWVYADGIKQNGLVVRRNREAELYFTKLTNDTKFP